MSSSTTAPFRRLRDRPVPRWEFLPADEALAARLANGAGHSPLMARLLSARGFASPEEVDDFLRPALAKIHDPFLLTDMDRAVERIREALDRKQSIYIYGDYDVDGITATAIVKSVFDFLGFPVATFIPHRLNDGYGMSDETVRLLAERGAELIVTVDNGISALEEVALARRLGMDVIVTDHHEPGPELPPACAVVNPKRPDCAYPFKELCGAGVAFKLAHALLKRLHADADEAKEFLKSLLDFAALGTIADIVPLKGENRCLAAHGLELLRSPRRVGLQHLMEVAGVDPRRIEAERLGFTLAPRLNAAGRTEHAEFALELLLTEDHQQARELASMLERFNDDRRRIESEITEEAFSLIDETSCLPAIVVEQEGWHLGVVGIVASRLLDRYYRPVIVLGVEGEWAKGSARSVRGFDMHAALTACGEHLEQYGGHAMAAGLRLRADAIENFRRALNAHATSILRETDLIPTIGIDARAEAGELTEDDVNAIVAMGPFGAGNRKPLLAIEGLNPIEEPRVLRGRHLKLHLADAGGREFWAIGFGMGDRAEELKQRRRALTLAATPVVNRWNGRARVEFEMKDFRTEDV